MYRYLVNILPLLLLLLSLFQGLYCVVLCVECLVSLDVKMCDVSEIV